MKALKLVFLLLVLSVANSYSLTTYLGDNDREFDAINAHALPDN